MAIFGQILKSPESGWRRYDSSNSNIFYEGSGWERYANILLYNGFRHHCFRESIKPKIKFNFIGSKIVLVSTLHPSYTNKIEIKIDEEIYETTQIVSGNTNIAVFFVKEGLKFKEHSVEITKINQGGYIVDFNLEAIDIDDSGQLKPYNPLSYKFLIQSERGYHSIFNGRFSSATAGYTGINELKMYQTPEPNILIHVPSMDKQNFINHGMDKSSVIDFEAEFTQKSFIKTDSSVLGDGKVFRQKIDTSKLPIKKVSIE